MRVFCAVLMVCSLAGAQTKLGKPLTLKEATPVEKVMASPDQYVGKVVQVKGKVVDLCQMMGCWMNLADPASGKMVRIKVQDGEIVFPKEAMGKMAIAEGRFVKLELTREQAVARARHEAEENKRRFDPTTVTGPVTMYQIAGAGAVILD